MPTPFGLALSSFFQSATSAAVEAIDDLSQFTNKLGQIVAKWDGIKEEWYALFNQQDVDSKGGMRVLKLDDAQQVLEDLRIGALKDRAITIYEDIKALIQLALHPIGGTEAGDKAIIAGASAYAGKPGAGAAAFKAASFINSVLGFMDRVLEIEDKILEVVRLVDIIDSMRDEMENSVLQQGNAQIRVDGKSRERQGALHSS